MTTGSPLIIKRSSGFTLYSQTPASPKLLVGAQPYEVLATHLFLEVYDIGA